MTKKAFFLLLIVSFALLLFLRFRVALFPVKAQGTNLLENGDFETGKVAPWGGISDAQITSTDVYSGKYAVHITSEQYASQLWITVQPGKTYVYTGFFKWLEFSGTNWGYDTFNVNDDNWQTLAVLNNLHDSYEQGKWHKLALTFTATTDNLSVNFGVFGPQERINLYFDDFELFEKTGNLAPTINPTANPTSGQAPLTVNFTANGNDFDGAIQYWYWDFGDGSTETIADPSHTFYKRGTLNVTLHVWDNDNAHVSQSLTINVTDNLAPTLTITSPTDQDSYTTNASSITLAGIAQAQSGNITNLVWDNINTEEAGVTNFTPAPTVSWSTGQISLKPGKNEILLTGTDANGRTGTDSLIVNRQVSGPVVSDIKVLSTDVKVYEKYEVTFKLETVAENTFFVYEENPPPGVKPKTGVTVEGVFRTPSGQTLRQPGFFYTEVVRTDTGEGYYGIHYDETTNKRWAVRFSPQETGQYGVSLSVRDASGSLTVPVGSFNAQAPTRQGFIKVSQADSRYFEFSNGDLFWPIGPAWEPDPKYKGTGINFDRPWMGGSGAYSTNWARWISSSEHHGNEGVMSRLNYKEHYPGHDLSREIFYPEGFRIWIPQWGDDQFHGQLKPNTNYQLKIRLKTQNISGPRNAVYPYGFVIRLSGFLSHETSLAETENALRNKPIILSHLATNKDWHTIITNFRMGNNALESDFNLYLDNVTNGQIYIDGFSVKEILSDGTLGPEFVRQKNADMHTYVDQRPAAYFDWQVGQGEENGVFFKYVIQDKNDWVPNHLLGVGIFYDTGHGYYQENGTKAKWHLQQWWRYLIARWGYSTAIHSWELNNEGPPDDGGGEHARATQEFAKFMHDNDAHPHLASTSFWCCWMPTFWGDHQKFPDVDYADIHRYIGENDTLSDGSLAAYDMAGFFSEYSQEVSQDKVGKPIIIAETGICAPGESCFPLLERSNPGIWYHNLLWVQLNQGSVSVPNYWWSQHLNQINREEISKPFYLFIRDLDPNKGGWNDLQANVSNANLRVYGQKNVARNGFYLWVQNKNHTWKNIMDGVNIAPQSGTITIGGFSAGKTLDVETWNTYTGEISNVKSQMSNENGEIILTVDNLTDDLAFRVLPEGLPSPSPTPPALKGDMDNDNDVDFQDALKVFSKWLTPGTSPDYLEDVNSDGKVNGVDFYWVIKDWRP